MPDFAELHRQRQQHPHVTQQLLWEEYRQANPDSYRYSRFCELYQRWRKQDVVLRQEHKSGEKLFVDWAGTTIPIYDSRGGPVQQAHLFVGVLGASSYTYAEATNGPVVSFRDGRCWGFSANDQFARQHTPGGRCTNLLLSASVVQCSSATRNKVKRDQHLFYTNAGLFIRVPA